MSPHSDYYTTSLLILISRLTASSHSYRISLLLIYRTNQSHYQGFLWLLTSLYTNHWFLDLSLQLQGDRRGLPGPTRFCILIAPPPPSVPQRHLLIIFSFTCIFTLSLTTGPFPLAYYQAIFFFNHNLLSAPSSYHFIFLLFVTANSKNHWWLLVPHCHSVSMHLPSIYWAYKMCQFLPVNRLNVCVPLRFLCGISNHQCDSIWGWGLGR